MGERRVRRRRPVAFVAAATWLSVSLCASPAGASCVGDCGNDGAVTIEEILTLVSIGLGTAAVTLCEAGDLNGDGQITVEEILSAVADALAGCTPVSSEWVQVDPTIALQDIWGASLTDIYVVGAAGRVLHFDGNTWMPMQSGTELTLLAVWGFAPDDVYAVGFNPQSFGNPAAQKGIILHYDGVAWSEVQHGQTDTFFRDVWGSGPRDVFVVGGIEGFGTPGVILHFDGANWTRQLLVNDSQPHNQLRGVWGFAPDDVYAVGSGQAPIAGNPGMQALAFHYDGNAWLRSGAFNGVLNTVWGSAPNDVYASGGPTGVAHFEGQQWSAVTTDQFVEGISMPIWGFGPQDIYFGLFHYDGANFVLTRDPESLLFDVAGLWGPPDGTVLYAAARNGVWQLQR